MEESQDGKNYSEIQQGDWIQEIPTRREPRLNDCVPQRNLFLCLFAHSSLNRKLQAQTMQNCSSQ